MSSELLELEKKLELKKVEKDIASEEAEIAQRKAVSADMKKKYGRDWKKILGLGVGTNAQALQSMYAVNPELRELSIPRRVGKR